MTTPTKLSLAHLRDEGWDVDICERWVPTGDGVGGIRKDFMGLLDLIAVRDGQTMGVQTTSDSNVPARLRKMTDDDHAAALGALRAANWTIVIHGWRKSTRDGHACKHGLSARCGCRWTLHRFIEVAAP